MPSLDAALALLGKHAQRLPLDGEIVFPGGRAVAWKEWAAARAGARRLPVDILMPAAAEFGEIDRIIYDELCRGVVRDTSRATLLRLAKDLRARGAQAVVLACDVADLNAGATAWQQLRVHDMVLRQGTVHVDDGVLGRYSPPYPAR